MRGAKADSGGNALVGSELVPGAEASAGDQDRDFARRLGQDRPLGKSDQHLPGGPAQLRESGSSR